MVKQRVLLLILAGITCTAAADARPDLSGVWVPVTAPPAVAASGGAVGLPPLDLTISQSNDSISISHTAFDQVTTMTYTFDGRENTNKTGAVTRLTKARWDEAAFIIAGKASQVTSQGYSAWTMKETLRVDREGRLNIESEHIASDGVITKGTKTYSRKKARGAH